MGCKASPFKLHPLSQAQAFQRKTHHDRTDRMEDLDEKGFEGGEQLEGADRVYSSSISPVKSFSSDDYDKD
jgi:hypothetical protein